MASSSPLFAVRDLTKRYGGRSVLASLDFDVARGECLVILGRSGCGKSVTLRQLNALDAPDAGSVRFDGVDLAGLSEPELVPIRRRIGMLFQSGALFDSMTVFDNVAFPLRQHLALEPDELARRVSETLARVRMAGSERRMPAMLSGGMRKRVALARALALEPEAMLYDEPTTGLDPMTAATIGELIREERSRSRVTSVVVTHDLALARLVGDRVAFLDGGRFRFYGTFEAADRSDDPLLAAFLAGRQEIDDEP